MQYKHNFYTIVFAHIIILFVSLFFVTVISPTSKLPKETRHFRHMSFSEYAEHIYQNRSEEDHKDNIFFGTKNIHEINFQKYLNNINSECLDIDSDYTVSIESLLFFDLIKDGKDEAIITAKTCMMGTGGPDIHSVYYLDSLNNIQEYKIDYMPKKKTKIIGIPMHLIGNRNYILTVRDSMLCADYWDGSGREHPLLQYFKFDNEKFILKKEVYGETFPTSFDCSKARSDYEIVACSCDSIAKMDVELSNLYKQLVSKLNPEEKSQLKKEQQQWLQDFDKVNAYKWLDEFSDRYRDRIAELKKMLTYVK